MIPLCPQFCRKIQQLADALPFDIRITQGFRSFGDQAAIYAKGRTVLSDIPCRHSNGQQFAPGTCQLHPLGAIVTMARAGYSWHNFGLAVDLVPMISGQPDWSDLGNWQAVINAGESVGLVNGKSWNDQPHFQLTGIFPVSPTDEVRSIFQHVGMAGVWVEAGLFSTSDQETRNA